MNQAAEVSEVTTPQVRVVDLSNPDAAALFAAALRSKREQFEFDQTETRRIAGQRLDVELKKFLRGDEPYRNVGCAVNLLTTVADMMRDLALDLPREVDEDYRDSAREDYELAGDLIDAVAVGVDLLYGTRGGGQKQRAEQLKAMRELLAKVRA